MLTEQDELGIYHVLQLHGRIRHIKLSLPPPILQNVLVLMDENFPILEHLALSRSFSVDHPPFTLPKGFLAPNLLHLSLSYDIRLSKRLRVLTSTVSLVTLTLRGIRTSSYFRPRLLVARLRSLLLLEELTISFSTLISHVSTERELVGESEAPITLPSLKNLWFEGVGAYLESLVAQIRVPLLERLWIGLHNDLAFVALPHLSYLINTTEAFKLPTAMVKFTCNGVGISFHHHRLPLGGEPFLLTMRCELVDRQIGCAAQICHALIPTLSGVQTLSLAHMIIDTNEIPIAMQIRPNGVIDATTWHDLLRMFIGVKQLHIYHEIMEEVSHALQVDEVASDLTFLPNLRSIYAIRNLFTSFIRIRQVMYRPVQFQVSEWP